MRSRRLFELAEQVGVTGGGNEPVDDTRSCQSTGYTGSSEQYFLHRIFRARSHVHESHDHCRSAPRDSEGFHTVGDDVEQRFQVGQVVDAYCTCSVDALDNRGIALLRTDGTIGGTLQHRRAARVNCFSLAAGDWILSHLRTGITRGEGIPAKLGLRKSSHEKCD